MTEIDKKPTLNKPNQTDLVQSVLEAHEKKNQDRVDMLITNAVKQLKMSRFKPDQSTCISLTYLARINPKVFHQSTTIREMLKSLLRRDAGPANIKGKTDMILPVLAANILLASCDSGEIRGIILNKLDQWLSGNSKVPDFVHNLVATICTKCQSDSPTISTLIEMRRHWIPYMLNSKIMDYQVIPSDLSNAVRQLFQKELMTDQMILYLNFLDKFDPDHESLSQALASLVLARPMTLTSMFNDPENGQEMARCLIKLFTRLLEQFRNKAKIKKGNHKLAKHDDDDDDGCEKMDVVGQENSEDTVKKETTTGAKVEMKAKDVESKISGDSSQDKDSLDGVIGNESIRRFVAPVYIKFLSDTTDSDILQLDKNTLEAILSLLSLIEGNQNLKEHADELARACLIKSPAKPISDDDHDDHIEKASLFSDWSLSKTYDISDQIRYQMYMSGKEWLIDLSLEGASVSQLIKLLCLFGSKASSLDKILKLLELVNDMELIRAEIADGPYFLQLIEFYVELGATRAKDFLRRLEQ